MIVVDLIHYLGVNVSQLDVSVHAVLAQKSNHWLKFEQDTFLVDLEIGLRLPKVIEL